MALREILQNIHSFVDILQQSRGRSVEAWRAEDVRNAVNWASYCEKIYCKAVGKSYQADLNECITSMCQSHMYLLGSTKIELELLKDAQNILCESLLQNPWLPSDIFQVLLDKTNRDDLIKNLMSASHSTTMIDYIHTRHNGNILDAELSLLEDFVDNEKLADDNVVSQIRTYLAESRKPSLSFEDNSLK